MQTGSHVVFFVLNQSARIFQVWLSTPAFAVTMGADQYIIDVKLIIKLIVKFITIISQLIIINFEVKYN